MKKRILRMVLTVVAAVCLLTGLCLSANAAEGDIAGDDITTEIHWAVVESGTKKILYLGPEEHQLNDGETLGSSGKSDMVFSGSYSSSTSNPKYTFNSTAKRPPYYSERADINKVVIEGELKPGSCALWFYGMENCTEIQGLDKLDTSAVTSVQAMFFGCSRITALCLDFNTENVTDMSHMFQGCRRLKDLDVSGLDTSSVENMSYMFYECWQFEGLGVSGFDTSNVTTMRYMFYDCHMLKTVDVSGFDTAKLESMRYMFAESGIREIDLSGLDTSNVTDMSGLFSGCWSLTNVVMTGIDTSNVTDMGSMFSECGALTSIDVSGFDTSNVTDLRGMFEDCDDLTSIDVSNFDTSNVQYIGRMFAGCSSLTELDVSNFDTSKVEIAGFMFSDCLKLKKLDISNFDLSLLYKYYYDPGEVGVTMWGNEYVIASRTIPMVILPEVCSIPLKLYGSYDDENGRRYSDSLPVYKADSYLSQKTLYKNFEIKYENDSISALNTVEYTYNPYEEQRITLIPPTEDEIYHFTGWELGSSSYSTARIEGNTLIIPAGSYGVLTINGHLEHDHEWYYEAASYGYYSWSPITNDYCYDTVFQNCKAAGDCYYAPIYESQRRKLIVYAPYHWSYGDGADPQATIYENTLVGVDTLPPFMYQKYIGINESGEYEWGEPTETPPINAGVYRASITIGGATAFVDYEIYKAWDTPLPPAAPELASRTETSITLKDQLDCEFSIDNGANWQTDTTFSNLKPNTPYTFIARISGENYQNPSANSEAATFYTLTHIAGVTLDQTELDMIVGATAQLTATVTPSSATDKSVVWSSSDESIVTVDQNGNVTAIDAGTATITVKTNDGGHTATCEVTVTSDSDDSWLPVLIILLQKYDVNAAATDGGTITPAGISQVRYGKDITYTITPDEGYVLSDVLVDGVSVGAVSVYTFDNVRKDHTVTAVFAKSPWENPYPDVKENDWFCEDVKFVTENGLMNDMGDGLFCPDLTATRAMIVTILWRLEGAPIDDSPVDFFDVPENEWYTDAVRWAAANGIVLGYEGLFNPEDPITREELSAILHRYATHKEWDEGAISPMIPQYDYSEWAENDIIWADMNGLFAGIAVDMTDLTADASRAEVAAILRRFCERFAAE